VAKNQSSAAKRVFFTKDDTALPIPNLIAHQKDSWREFVETGLSEIFAELNPIEDYTGQKLELRFKEYAFQDPKTTEQDAKENNLTFDAPLHANVELTNKVTGEVKEQEIYLGDYPWMTDRGTFVINGTERVVVSQLIRSAGVFFTADHAAGRNNYGAKLIPGRGAWLEFETAANGTIYVKIDRRRKLPITTLLRALGHSKTSEIKSLFADIDTGAVKYIDATLDKDPSKGANEALIEVYRRLRPGDLATVDNARSMIERMFFDFKRFDYSRVGRYKLNQRLALTVPNTTENRVFQMSDLIAIIRELIRLNNSQEAPDDIDALSNRRVKLVGELVARQFRVGMLRMQRNAMDRMSMSDLETVTPGQLINARPVVAAVREFFASSQLSQLMDEVNPLSELSHKRRLSSMGPGGLSRERAGFDVRDAHPTHYGRLSSVETPEGANIGLVLNLASYARVNEYGFIETPYRKVIDGKVSDTIHYLDAAQELTEVIADAGAKLKDDGSFAEDRVSARNKLNPEQVDAVEVTYMDAANKQILGPPDSLIPFIEKNRVDRSLTGTNMQKQAVPLLTPESPTVGTGIEAVIAQNTSRSC
jgi:DNA-directed RNA polymerase subunit beta